MEFVPDGSALGWPLINLLDSPFCSLFTVVPVTSLFLVRPPFCFFLHFCVHSFYWQLIFHFSSSMCVIRSWIISVPVLDSWRKYLNTRETLLEIPCTCCTRHFEILFFAMKIIICQAMYVRFCQSRSSRRQGIYRNSREYVYLKQCGTIWNFYHDHIGKMWNKFENVPT